MMHPLVSIPTARRSLIFWLMLALTLGLLFLFNVIGAPLVTPSAPYGIVSYELAGSVPVTGKILASWNTQAQLNASFSLGLDYVFMLVYSATIGLACIWAAETLRLHQWPLAWAGVPLAWGLILAAGCDAVENLALVVILFGRLQNPWPALAQVCAIVKFSLIFLGMSYAFLAAAVNLVGRLSSRSTV